MSDCALKGAATKGKTATVPRERTRSHCALPAVLRMELFPFRSNICFQLPERGRRERRAIHSFHFFVGLGRKRGEREREERPTERPTAATMKRVLLGRFPSSVLFMPPTGGRTRTDGGGLRWRRGNRLLPKKVGKTVRHDTGDHDRGRRRPPSIVERSPENQVAR